MVLVGVIGNPRCGKTLLETIILKKLIDKSLALGARINEDRFYFANYHFYGYLQPYVKYLSEPADLMHIKLPALYTGVTALDELYVWLESRGSGGNSINKILSHVAFQSGKSGFDILWSAQLSSSVDKRIRLLTDFFLVALTPTELKFRYAYVSSNRVKRFSMTRIKATEFYPLYDTRERILPLELEQEAAVKAEFKKEQERLQHPIDSLEEKAIQVHNDDEQLSQEEKEQTMPVGDKIIPFEIS